MELKERFYIIKNRFILIFCITLGLTLITGILSYFVIKPVYKADISVMIGKTQSPVNNSASNYYDAMLYQTMVKTYAKLTNSRLVAEDVLKKLKLSSMKVSDLLAIVTVTPDTDTQFLTISVQSQEPVQAMNIANQFAISLKSVSSQLNKIDIVDIIDEAQLPAQKDSPKPVLNMAMAFLIGIIFSVGLVFLLEYLDNTIKTKEDVEKGAGLAVIGTLNLNEKKDNEISDQFRTLRANIRFSSIGDEIKSIVVTSAIPGEGKSTVVSNLAVAMASSGKRVVIMDCDFRNPTIHKNFSLTNLTGLTNVLVEDTKICEVITATKVPNLFVIPSGPKRLNPTELLESKNMKIILSTITKAFDIVLIDTPSILSITDAQILSALVRGTIIVASYGKPQINDIINVKQKIEKAGGWILGVVINKIPEKYNGH